jgi:hypothetical protein
MKFSGLFSLHEIALIVTVGFWIIVFIGVVLL